MAKLKLHAEVIVKPGQMRSGCKGKIIARLSKIEWKVIHEDGARRIYTTGEIEEIALTQEKVEIEGIKEVEPEPAQKQVVNDYVGFDNIAIHFLLTEFLKPSVVKKSSDTMQLIQKLDFIQRNKKNTN